MTTYKEELTRAMGWLAQQPDVVFVGQNIVYGGNALFDTLKDVPSEKRIELPVMEEAQMGMSIGLALTGKTVISIYPRFDFLLLAMNQLVNHLDKLEEFTHGEYHAKVIIRVGIGATSPLYPGVQHCGDYTEALKFMLKKVQVLNLSEVFYQNKEWGISDTYKYAYYSKDSQFGATSFVIVEDMNLYSEY